VGSLLNFPNRPIYGCLGLSKPEAYQVNIPQEGQQAFVLGPYGERKIGGCDCIQPYSSIPKLIDRYAAQGHVVFEGSLMSDNYGLIGEHLKKYKDQVVIVVLDTPIEECLRRMGQRTETTADPERRERKTRTRHKNVQVARKRFIAEGFRVIDAPSTDKPDFLLGLLGELI
jgi:hypothetical protein